VLTRPIGRVGFYPVVQAGSVVGTRCETAGGQTSTNRVGCSCPFQIGRCLVISSIKKLRDVRHLSRWNILDLVEQNVELVV